MRRSPNDCYSKTNDIIKLGLYLPVERVVGVPMVGHSRAVKQHAAAVVIS